MVTFLAFAMVATFMALIMTGRVSALVALIVVPTAFALAAGFYLDLGSMIIQGVEQLAPTGVMLLFAILYFGLMIDAGLFDPLVTFVVRAVHGDPVKITLGTALLALSVSLDGDGTTTYMITVAAMLPLYKHMKMDPRIMACLIIMSGAVMNILPWGGPTARAASALGVDPGELFVPLLPAMAITALWVLFVAWIFGRRERKRLLQLGILEQLRNDPASLVIAEDEDLHVNARRPGLFWFNLMLTLTLMAMLILGLLPLAVLFMLGFAIAALVNYPSLEQQRERIASHASNVLAVVGLIFAAGVFMGILSGTKMVDAMAGWVIAQIPQSMGPYMTIVTAALSAPFTFLISNDAFYFGILPVLAQAGTNFGVTPVEIARASLVGQQIHLLSPLVASTYLLVGMSGIELGEHQKFTLPWAAVSCVVFLIACLLLGAFPICGAV
jgi:CitMHS family citrate-Mg2+:H+ or citrate-Ca2+:H+ symporter